MHWLFKDEKVEELPGVGSTWRLLACGDLPPGLDYFMLDCAVCFGIGTAQNWLKLVTATDSYDEACDRAWDLGSEVVISGIELFRRRRMKSDPLWHQKGSDWSNRCTRAKLRALRLAEPEGMQPPAAATA